MVCGPSWRVRNVLGGLAKRSRPGAVELEDDAGPADLPPPLFSDLPAEQNEGKNDQVDRDIPDHIEPPLQVSKPSWPRDGVSAAPCSCTGELLELWEGPKTECDCGRLHVVSPGRESAAAGIHLHQPRYRPVFSIAPEDRNRRRRRGSWLKLERNPTAVKEELREAETPRNSVFTVLEYGCWTKEQSTSSAWSSSLSIRCQQLTSPMSSSCFLYHSWSPPTRLHQDIWPGRSPSRRRHCPTLKSR
jgi:hypothetical protein